MNLNLLHRVRLFLDPPTQNFRKGSGKWRIQYHDKHLSARLSYGDACIYAKHFKGSVVRADMSRPRKFFLRLMRLQLIPEYLNAGANRQQRRAWRVK